MLKICFSKNISFFGTTSIGGGGGSDGFYQTKKIFLKTSHPYWSVKKKFEKIMKNIGDMAKRTFIKKPQFFLYVKTSACSHWEQLQKYKKSNKSCEICVSYQALGQF